MPKRATSPTKEISREIHRLEAIQDGRRLKVLLASTTALGLSSWLTAKGHFDKAIEAGVANAEGIVTAAMSAGVAGTVMSTATMILVGVAVEASRRQRRHVLALVGAMLPFTFGVSTYNAVLGNAGPPSLVYEMRDSAQSYIEYYAETEADAARALSAAATLAPLQTSTCYLGEQERENGVLTGSAGRGTTYAAYSSACQNIGTIIETLNDTAARADERGVVADELLAELLAIPDDTSLSVFERQAAFRDTVREIEALVDDAGAEQVSARLGPQLEILEASIAGLGTASGALGDRQAAANANLTNTLGTVHDTVQAFVSPESTTLSKPGALRDMGAAVLAYWHRNIPQILLAVLIDLMPGWFLGLLMVSRGTFEDRRRELLKQGDSASRQGR